MRKHGMTKHPIYQMWQNIKARCYNKNNPGYKWWGGKGVTMSKDWHDFETFKEDCLELGWKPGLSIDRIDNDGNYEKGNVRFVSNQENLKNRPTVVPPGKAVANIDTEEVFRSIKAAARAYNVDKVAITSAIARGGRCASYRWVILKDTDQIDFESLRNAFQPGKTREEARGRKVINLDTMQTYNSIRAAADSVEAQSCAITAAIKRSGTCNGFRWAFLSDLIETES